MYRQYVPSARNSSYSFRLILFKLYRCFKDGLKICILFFQNPEFIFYHIFFIFNLDFFQALIPQKCIGSIYLLPATPPTVLGQSFWNFTGAFRMVWRYANCFFRILKLFLSSLVRSTRRAIVVTLVVHVCVFACVCFCVPVPVTLR